MKNIFLTFLLLIFFTSSFAQGERRQRLKAYKTAYITQELDLTAKEAEIFWPIYNQYEQERHEIKVSSAKNEKQKIREKGGIDILSDNEVNALLNKLIKDEEQITALKKNLIDDLKKVLPPKKILKLYRAEHEFNRKLLMEYRKRQMKEMQDRRR
ncbi:MAG: sensor of ECF-type sigma factor [Bacteroidota bacterium]